MSMLISEDLVRMSSGARRAVGVMGVVVLTVARHAKMGLVSGLQHRYFTLKY